MNELQQTLLIGTATIVFNGRELHVRAHGREIDYRVTDSKGRRSHTRGLMTVNLTTLRPCVWIPVELQRLFGRELIEDATLAAWCKSQGVEA